MVGQFPLRPNPGKAVPSGSLCLQSNNRKPADVAFLVCPRFQPSGERPRAGPLILVGDSFHNFIDGTIITAAFLSDLSLGIMTAVAVIAHEVPQEIGDFAILLESGYPRGKAVLYNLLSSLTTLPGALLGYYYLSVMQVAVPYVLAVSAASFIYIALADLIPGLHEKIGLRISVIQFGLLMSGVGTIFFFLLHHR